MVLADWDPRLISPEQALHMAGDWEVYAAVDLAELEQYGDQSNRWQINLRCRKCTQSCGMLGVVSGLPGQARDSMGTDVSYLTSIGDLLSGILRHLVTAHDWSLSGAHNGE